MTASTSPSNPHKHPRVGIVSPTLGSLPNPVGLGYVEALSAIDNNVGNLAFQGAIGAHVAEREAVFDFGEPPGGVRERCDVLVIPEANAANPHRDWNGRADWIEACDLPVVVVGLGAQAARLNEEVELTPGTIRYLQALSERTTELGVRGEFTANVLHAHGIANSVVIGCPSNFLNPATNLGEQLLPRYSESPERVAVAAGSTVRSLKSLERKLFRWAVDTGGVYVPQSGPLVQVWSEWDHHDDAAEEKVFRFLTQLGAIRPWRRETFRQQLSEHLFLSFDIEEWMRRLSTCNISLGTRFHGNMLAFQTGVPAIFIGHDARTVELAATIGVPSIDVATAQSARSINDLLATVEFDGAAYDSRRRELASRYVRLLNENGVTTTDRLSGLTTDSVGPETLGSTE